MKFDVPQALLWHERHRGWLLDGEPCPRWAVEHIYRKGGYSPLVASAVYKFPWVLDTRR